jgi:Tfp pilus assembly protein PilP
MIKTLPLAALLIAALALSACGRRADMEDLTPVTSQPGATEAAEPAPAQ